MSKTTYYTCDTCEKTTVYNQPLFDLKCSEYMCTGNLNVIKANQNIAAHNKIIRVFDKDLKHEVAKFTGANFEVIDQKEDFYIVNNNVTTAIFDKNMYEFTEGNGLFE